MDASTWTLNFATALGVPPPSDAEVEALLSLASVAANASERPAAPIACYLAAKAGAHPDRALALARTLTGDAAGPT